MKINELCKLFLHYLGSWRVFTPPRAVAKRPLNTPYLNCAQKSALFWLAWVYCASFRSLQLVSFFVMVCDVFIKKDTS